MKIKRDDNTLIKKRKINLKSLEPYDENKVSKAVEYLNNEITNSFTSHFDNIAYVLDKKDNFSSCNKNTGCISDCKRLKKQLNKFGLKTYYVSCKANGFSNPAGDSFIKESHVFLIYPSIKNKNLYFTIFDPGFRINNPISFSDCQNSQEIDYLGEGIAKVNYIKNDINYPYKLTINKRMNYKHQIVDANIHWRFNPYYETLNIDDYNEKLYSAMFSLKLMNYPSDLNKYLCIRSKLLDDIVEIYTLKKNKIYYFQELTHYNKNELRNIFKLYFFEANLSNKVLNNFTKNLFLLIHNKNKYIESTLNQKVIEEYKLGHTLNR